MLMIDFTKMAMDSASNLGYTSVKPVAVNAFSALNDVGEEVLFFHNWDKDTFIGLRTKDNAMVSEIIIVGHSLGY